MTRCTLVLPGLILTAALALKAGEPPDKPDASPAAVFNGVRLPWPEPGAAEVSKLKETVRKQLTDEFRILQAGPWLLVTDLSDGEAMGIARSTVASGAARIQRQMFTHAPRREPVIVYLFKNAASYEQHNQKLFGEKPASPYGYFSRARQAMVMNIETGGGTLLHEMTHAMAEADFPSIPAWLNEGIGSLFEGCRYMPGDRIAGAPNWRLPGLQKAVKAGKAPHLDGLMRTDDDAFYGENSGTNYAAARYLMMYLQEQGKLEAFYSRIRDKKDADAQASLRAVFENKLTLAEIEKALYAWVETLRWSNGS